MWDYTKKVMDHFLNPRNVGEMENPDAMAEVGNITCGDALKLYLKLDDKGRISDCKFQTFGCASAIASSSVLTEMVKGMTLEEASKITNKDIAGQLDSLPPEKMHCSVMGMEALQAAIADYRRRHGEKVEESTADGDEHEGKIVCKCFSVTDTKIRRVAKENNLHTVEEITRYTKAGGACGSCLDQIQMILDELWKNDGKAAEATPVPATGKSEAFDKLSMVQKIVRVQEVIDQEIRPALRHDGGDIELVDLRGDTAVVKLKGHCESCMAASVTLRNLVQSKLNEFVSPKITVEAAK